MSETQYKNSVLISLLLFSRSFVTAVTSGIRRETRMNVSLAIRPPPACILTVRAIQNLLRTLTETSLNSPSQGADLRLLLTTVKEGRVSFNYTPGGGGLIQMSITAPWTRQQDI